MLYTNEVEWVSRQDPRLAITKEWEAIQKDVALDSEVAEAGGQDLGRWGRRQLEKMGWKEGKGLGKYEQGEVEPVGRGDIRGVEALL